MVSFIPELLAPLETGITVFSIQLPELYGASNLILAALLIAIIIFRRQGIMGYSEVITESLFSFKTYRSIIRKEEYVSLAAITVGYFRRISNRLSRKGLFFSNGVEKVNKLKGGEKRK